MTSILNGKRKTMRIQTLKQKQLKDWQISKLMIQTEHSR